MNLSCCSRSSRGRPSGKATFFLNCIILMFSEFSRGFYVASMFHFALALAGGDTIAAAKSNSINVAAYNVGRLIAAQFWGWCVDRTSFRNVFVIALAIATVGNLMYTLAEVKQGIPVLLPIARAVIGLGSGISGVARALVPLLTSPAQRTSWYSLASAARFVGYGLSPTIAILFGDPPDDPEDEILGGPHWDCFTIPAIVLGGLNLLLLPVLWIWFDPELTGQSKPRYAVLSQTGERVDKNAFREPGRSSGRLKRPLIGSTTSLSFAAGGADHQYHEHERAQLELIHVEQPLTIDVAAAEPSPRVDFAAAGSARGGNNSAHDRTPLLGPSSKGSSHSLLAMGQRSPPRPSPLSSSTGRLPIHASLAPAATSSRPLHGGDVAFSAHYSDRNRRNAGSSDAVGLLCASQSDSGVDAAPVLAPGGVVAGFQGADLPLHRARRTRSSSTASSGDHSGYDTSSSNASGGSFTPPLPPESPSRERLLAPAVGFPVSAAAAPAAVKPPPAIVRIVSEAHPHSNSAIGDAAVSDLDLNDDSYEGSDPSGSVDIGSASGGSGGGDRGSGMSPHVGSSRAHNASKAVAAEAGRGVLDAARSTKPSSSLKLKRHASDVSATPAAASRNSSDIKRDIKPAPVKGSSTSSTSSAKPVSGLRALLTDPIAGLGAVVYICVDAVSKGVMTLVEAVAPALLNKINNPPDSSGGGGGGSNPYPTDDDYDPGTDDSPGDTTYTALWFAALGAVGLLTFILLALPRKDVKNRCLRLVTPSDTTLLLMSSCATGLGAFIMANPWPQTQTLVGLSAGAVLVWSFGTCVEDVVVTSCFSVLIQGLGAQGAWMGHLTTAGCMGRILLPLVTVVSSPETALMIAAGLTLGGIPALLLYQCCKRRATAAALP